MEMPRLPLNRLMRATSQTMRSDTETTNFTDGSRALAAASSILHVTESSGPAVNDSYASAPFLLQSRNSQSAQQSELLAVDTPPSSPQPDIYPQYFGQQLRPALQDASSPHIPSRMPTTVGAPLQDEAKLERKVSGQQTSSPMSREASVWSDACANDSFAFLRNPAEACLSYSWRESYLDESPSATKARWMRQQTFGPVMHSEGGGSSTVSSSPRTPWGKGVFEAWGRVKVHSAFDHDCSAEFVDEHHVGEDDERNRIARGGGCVRQRRFDLPNSEIGEQPSSSEESHHDGAFFHSPIGNAGMHAKPVIARQLLRWDTSDSSTCKSNASTIIATVQQPRRIAQIAPIGKVQKLLPEATALNPPEGPRLPADNAKTERALSPIIEGSPQAADLSWASLDRVTASRTLSPVRPVRTECSGNVPASGLASKCPGPCNRDVTGGKCNEIEQGRGKLRSSRCGPPRGRVLKVLYED